MAVSSLVTVFATLDLRLHRHEQAAAFTLYLVSDDFSRIVALADAPGAPRRGHELALPELEHTRRIRIVERSQRIAPFGSRAPVDVKRADAVNLDDRRVRSESKHRGALRDEYVSASFDLGSQRLVELLADPEKEGSLNDGDVLVD